MSKGSVPRKFSVDHQTFSSNWDAIFGNKHGNKSPQGDQLHSGERSTVRTSESQQSVRGELSGDSEIKTDA